MQVGFIMARSKQEGLSLENYEVLNAPAPYNVYNFCSNVTLINLNCVSKISVCIMTRSDEEELSVEKRMHCMSLTTTNAYNLCSNVQFFNVKCFFKVLKRNEF